MTKRLLAVDYCYANRFYIIQRHAAGHRSAQQQVAQLQGAAQHANGQHAVATRARHGSGRLQAQQKPVGALCTGADAAAAAQRRKVDARQLQQQRPEGGAGPADTQPVTRERNGNRC